MTHRIYAAPSGTPATTCREMVGGYYLCTPTASTEK